MMRWEDERYVRLYTKDTGTWKKLPWQSRCLLPLILRKLDRTGVLELDGDGVEDIAMLTELPLEIVEAGMPKLLSKGVFVMTNDRIAMPKFMDAQEANQSDKARKAAQRERDRAKALKDIEDSNNIVTNRDTGSRKVIPCHENPRPVTPCLSVPGLAMQSIARKDKETCDRTAPWQHVPIPPDVSAGASPPEVSLPSNGVTISPAERTPAETASSCQAESPEAPAAPIGQLAQDATLIAPFCETVGQVTEPVSSQPQSPTETHTVLPATTPVCPPLAQEPTLPAVIVSYLSTVLEPMVWAILHASREPALKELSETTTEQVSESLLVDSRETTETYTPLPTTLAIPGTPEPATPPPTPAEVTSCPPPALKPKWLTMLHASREPALTELPRPTTQQVETVSEKPHAHIETLALFPETETPVCPPARAKTSPRPKGARMTPTAVEQSVFDHWVTAMGKTGRAIFADERIKPVRDRLAAGFSVDDLKQAIDGCAKSTFHMGVNDQHRAYNDLELICRDAKHVESFLTTAESKALVSKAEKAALDPKRPYMLPASREEIAAGIAKRKQNGRRSYIDIAAGIAI